MKIALGIFGATATGPYCEALHLRPFTLEQMAEALRCCSPSVRDGILKLASEDSKFREVISRGSLLYVVSQLWERKSLSKYAGPLDSAAILELFLDSSYRRQSQKSRGGPQFMILNDAERRYFMLGIAAYMGAGSLPNQIDKSSFTDAVTRLYDIIPSQISKNLGSLDQGPTKPLKQRLVGEDDPVGCVENDVRSSAVLVVDQTKPGALRFAHKSFMEFLIAKGYADFLSCTDEGASAIGAIMGVRAKTILKSDEVASFFAELVSRDCPPDPRRISYEMYKTIVRGRTTGSRWKPFFGMFTLITILMTRVSPRRPSATAKHNPLVSVLIRFPMSIVTAVVALSSAILAVALSHYGHREKASLISVGLLGLVGMCQGLMFGYVQSSSDMAQRVSLWLACCEILKIAPSDVTIFNHPNSSLIGKLVTFDRKTTID